MEDSHKSNTSETAPQSGSTVQAAHISHIAQQVSSLSESEESQDSSDSIGSSQKTHGILARHPSYRKILKDLSSEDTRGRKGDGENPGVSAVNIYVCSNSHLSDQHRTVHCHCPRWSLTAGQSRHRWSTGPSDINRDKFRQYSARYNNSPVCTDF